jgi:hypothetical protein
MLDNVSQCLVIVYLLFLALAVNHRLLAAFAPYRLFSLFYQALAMMVLAFYLGKWVLVLFGHCENNLCTFLDNVTAMSPYW